MKRGAKRPLRRYAFDEWFARKSFTLRRGINYACRTYGMAGMIRNQASKRRLSVTVVMASDEMSLSVTVHGRVDGRR